MLAGPAQAFRSGAAVSACRSIPRYDDHRFSGVKPQ
jgi:hypothetical protein